LNSCCAAGVEECMAREDQRAGRQAEKIEQVDDIIGGSPPEPFLHARRAEILTQSASREV
jgi:hypothetical protein